MLIQGGRYEPDAEQVTLRVSNKVLYVGNEMAYPLSGLVRVQWGQYIPRTGRAIRQILLNLTVFALLFSLAKGLNDSNFPLLSNGPDSPSMLSWWAA
jgi:hypothetical protein